MTTVASLRILLGLDSKDVRDGAGSAKRELQALQKEAEKTRKSLTEGFKAGIGIGAGFGAFSVASEATRALVSGIEDSISAASNLNETLSKSSVIFGQNAAAVDAWGNTAAKSLGLSKQQAIEAAATFGNLFTTMGLGNGATRDMSLNIVQLASDLASFNNLDPTDALQKLRSGLVGEAEPLRSLGVQLTEATVAAKAMKMGLADSNGVLSESAKVQARYALILEQTKTAQGDFSRTSSGLANSQRIANAALDDASAKLGEKLLPAVTELAHFTSDVLAPALGVMADNLGTVVAVAEPFAIAYGVKVAGSLVAAAAAAVGFGKASVVAAGEVAAASTAEVVSVGAVAAAFDAMAASAAAAWIKAMGPLIIVAAATAAAVGEVRQDDERLAEAQRKVASGSATLYDRLALQAAAHRKAADATKVQKVSVDEVKDSFILADASVHQLNASMLDSSNSFRTEVSAIDSVKDASITAADGIYKMGAEATAAGNAAVKAASKWAYYARSAWEAGHPSATDAPGGMGFGADSPPTGGMSMTDAYLGGLFDPKVHPLGDGAGGGATKAADDTASAIRDAFGRMRDAAHAYFDAVHEGRIREIEDARDTANADIDNQLRSIRERVSAERDRVNGMRAARQEESLRAAVAAAKTPQELARAQQSLNDFLDDQRLAFIDRQAAQQEAALNAQKQANTANAAALTQTENERYQAQVKLFDETLGALEKYLSDHPKLWKTWQDKVVGVLKAGNIDYEKAGKENADAYLRGLRKVLSNVNVKAAPSASGSVGTSTSAVATNLAWVGDGKIGDVFLDADKVGEVLGKRNAALIAIYNPTSVSTGAQQ